MSIGFVVGAMVICGALGFEKMAKLFAFILWAGLTIAHPGLIFLWIGLAYLFYVAKNK